jgi:hypothetical protein
MKNTRTKSMRFWALLVTLLMPGILSLGALAEADGGPTASGHVALGLEDDALVVAFKAIGQKDGTATGQIDLHSPSALPDQDVDGTGDPSLAGSKDGVAVQAAVNCLAVDGSTAIVGGVVTASSIERYIGKQVLLFVEDSAKLSGGFSWGFHEPQEDVFCDSFPWAAYTPQSIAEGSLEVQQ